MQVPSTNCNKPSGRLDGAIALGDVMTSRFIRGSTDARLTDTGCSRKRRMEDCSTNSLLLDNGSRHQVHFTCHAVVFRVSGLFCWVYRHRAVPGGMDGATVSVLSLAQLITALLLIVKELCHRFRIPLSSTSSVPL